MKKDNYLLTKKGFTIVELLGVIVILGIIMGLAVVGYVNVRNSMKNTYYDQVEETALMSASDYFNYNKSAVPDVFGEPSVVTFKQLADQKYMDEILDQEGNLCDLDSSYVKAYKEKYDKIEYLICIRCEGFESAGCNENVQFGIRTKMTIGKRLDDTIIDTNKLYVEGDYSKAPVILHFETDGDVSQIILENSSGTEVKRCNTQNSGGTKKCNLTIDSSGDYNYYGLSGSSKVGEKSVSIRIDETEPTLNVTDTIKGVTTEIPITTTNRNALIGDSAEEKVVINVNNISDSGSGIKKIRYSFENKDDGDNFKSLSSSTTSFEIEKKFTPGDYVLKIEITDAAGNTTKYNVTYGINIELEELGSFLCNDITYDGLEHELATGFSGVILSNNLGTNAGDYNVTAKAAAGYIFANGSETETFICTIKRKVNAQVGECNTLTYNGTTQTLASNGVNVFYEDNEEVNAGDYEVIVNAQNNYAFGIVVNEDGVEEEEIQRTLNCSIGTKNVVVTPNSNQKKTYGESDPTLTYTLSGIINGEVPIITGNLGREIGENVGTYKINLGNLSLIDSSDDSFISANYNLTLNPVSVNFAITSRSTSDFDVNLSSSSFDYDGTEHKPSVTIKDGSKTLVEGVDYNITYHNTINAGTSDVTINYIGNYTGTTVKQYTIKKRVLTITANSVTKTYGADNPSLSYAYSGNISGESPKFSGSLATTATKNSPKGVYDITQGTLVHTTNGSFISTNYELKYVSGTITINPKSITNLDITLGSTSLIYNGSDQTPSVALKNGETVLTINSDYTLTYSNNKNVGTGSVKITGQGNYSGEVTKSFQITKRTLTVTANNVSKFYGDQNPTLSFGYSGQVSGETPSFTGNLTTEATKDSEVGIYDINQGTLNIVDNGVFKKNNYNLEYVKASLTINFRSSSDLTIGEVTGTYTYDGSNKTPSLVIKDGSKTLVSGTDYTLSYQNNKNAALKTSSNPPTVIVTFKGNYEGTVNRTFTIGKKTVVITANEQSKIYDQENPTLTYSYTGVVTGEEPLKEGSLTTSATKESNVGVYDILIGTLNFKNNDNYLESNYTVSYTKANLIIYPKSFDVVTPTYTIGTIVYDGNYKEPSVVLKDGSKTLVNNTDYKVTYTNNKNAGTALITVEGQGNYEGEFEKNFTIGKRDLNVVAANKSKNFGDNNPTLTYTYSNQVSGETPSFTGSLTTEATKDSSVGTYDITLGNLTHADNGNFKKNNYNLKFTKGTLTINQISSSSLTVSDITSTYTYSGVEHKPTLVIKDGSKTLVSGTDYTLSYQNNKNAALSTATNAPTVTATLKGNYSGTLSKNFTINKKTITIVADAKSKIYSQENPELTYTYSGNVEGETPLPTGSLTTSATTTSPVGTYDILIGTLKFTNNNNYLESNYTVSYTKANLTIAKKGISSLTTTYSIGSLKYNGENQEPGVTIKNGTITLVKGTDYSVSYTNNKNAGVGTAKITITGQGNYTGTLDKTFTINKKDLNVIADDKTREYGSANPALTYTYNGQVGSEVPKFTGSIKTDATTTSSVGTYPIYQNTLDITDNGSFLKSNYNVVFTNGNLSVTNKNLSLNVTLSQTTYTYDGTNHKPTVTAKDGDVTLIEGTDYTISYSNNKNAGTASVTLNYKGNYSGSDTVNFVINKRKLTITADNKEINYRDSLPTFTSTPTGQVSGETPKYTITMSSTATQTSNIGVYDILINTLSLSNNGTFLASNYDTIVEKGELTIHVKNAVSLGVTLNPTSYTYTGSAQNPSIEIKDGSYTLVKGTDYSVSYSNNVNAGTARANITYSGNYAGAVSKNYTINKANDVLTINSTGAKTYNGTAISPSVTAKSGTALTYKYYNGSACSGTALTSAPVQAGDYSFTVTSAGNSNYNSKTSGCNTVKISAKEITGTVTLSQTTYTYDGTDHKPSVTVKDGSTTLTSGTDYDISYTNYKNAGTASVTVTYKGNYSGSNTINYTINKVMLTVTADDKTMYYRNSLPTFTYTATGQLSGETPKFTITLKTNATTSSSAGVYDILCDLLTPEDNGSFLADNYDTQFVKGKLTINVKDASSLPITLSPTSFIYSGSALKPTVTIVDGSYTLVESIDYTVTYSNNVNASTSSSKALVSVTYTGNYSGTASKEYTINKKTGTITITSVGTKTYDGNVVSPQATASSGSTVSFKFYSGTTCTGTALTSRPIDVGTYSFIATSAATANYNSVSSACTKVNINARSCSSATITLNPTSYTYSGSANSPSATVVVNSKTLTNNTDYTIAYTNNTNAGEGTATITCQGNYTGSASKAYTISKANDVITINSTGAKTYDGTAISPSVTAKSGTTLTYKYYNGTTCAGTALTSAPTQAGDYSFTVTSAGNSNYNSQTSSCTSVSISQRSCSSATITLSPTSYTYSGSANTPNTTVVVNSKTLTKNTDYTVSYTNNTNAGTSTTKPTATITCKGNYTGSASKEFTINKNTDVVSLTEVNTVYTGNPIAANTATATSGTTITYKYFNGTTCGGTELGSAPSNVGTYSVLATSAGNANYNSGSICVKHTIVASSSCNITLSSTTFTYTGSEIKPTATVRSGTTTLTSGTDYTLAYTNNTNAGTGTVTATCKGNYSGTGTANFTINKASSTITCQTGKVYNGNDQIIATCSAGCNVTNGTQKNAGSYTVTGTAKNSNYNAPTSKSCSIAKATPTLTTSSSSSSVDYNATGQFITLVKADLSVAGVLSASTTSSNIEINSDSVSQSVTATTTGVSKYIKYNGISATTNASTINVKFTPTDTTNWNSANLNYTVSAVNKLATTLTINPIQVTHANGSSSNVLVGDTLTVISSLSPTDSDVVKSCAWYRTTTDTNTGGTEISTNCSSYLLVNDDQNKYIYFKMTISDGSNYSGSDTKTVKLGQKILNTAVYTVKKYLMANDGENYYLEPVEYYEATIGESITVEPEEIDNFVTPESINKIISANESENVFEFRYTRTCFGNICDLCKYEDPIGACLYDRRGDLTDEDQSNDDLKLWQSGLNYDTTNEVVRFTKDNPNNYVCFGTNGNTCVGNNLYRIIGVFGTNHQLRIISNSSVGRVFFRNATSDDWGCHYHKSNVKTGVEAVWNTYQTLVGDNSTMWKNLSVSRSFYNICAGGNPPNSSTEYFLNVENGVSTTSRPISNVTAYPLLISDLMLSTKNTGYTLYKNNSHIKANSWLPLGSNEWSIHCYNTARAYALNTNMAYCAFPDDTMVYLNASGSKVNCNIGGYYTTVAASASKYKHYYRLTTQLNENVLFCGGSGTIDSPYIIGYGSCLVSGSTASLERYNYNVDVYQMSNDGVNYTKVSSNTYQALKDSSFVIEPPEEYDNFITPPSINATISENNMTFEFRYDRICYGDMCNYCSINSTMGDCLNNLSVESDDGLNIINTGLERDTENYRVVNNVDSDGNILPVSTSPVNNYVCFGTRTDCANDLYKYRIIGFFGENKQVRLIKATKATTKKFDDGGAGYYKSSTLKTQINSYINNNLNGNLVTDVTWKSLMVNQTINSIYNRTARDFSAQQFIDYETGYIAPSDSRMTTTYHAFPLIGSDALLAYGDVNYKFTDATNHYLDSWIYANINEWTIHAYSTAYIWFMCGTDDCGTDGAAKGRICMGLGQSETYPDGDSPSCSPYTGYKDVSRDFRITFQLNENVLFCGGSGNENDPFILGYGTCDKTGLGKAVS